MSKKLVLVSVASGVIVIVGVLWLIVSGKLTVTWKSEPGGDRVRTATQVCGDETITAYNYAAYYTLRGDSQVPSLDTGGMLKIAEDIRKMDGYADDPTCQAILFLQAYSVKEYSNAKVAYDAIKRLHGQGKFVNNNLRGVPSLAEYEPMLQTVNPSATQGQGKPRG